MVIFHMHVLDIFTATSNPLVGVLVSDLVDGAQTSVTVEWVDEVVGTATTEVEFVPTINTLSIVIFVLILGTNGAPLLIV